MFTMFNVTNLLYYEKEYYKNKCEEYPQLKREYGTSKFEKNPEPKREHGKSKCEKKFEANMTKIQNQRNKIVKRCIKRIKNV